MSDEPLTAYQRGVVAGFTQGRQFTIDELKPLTADQAAKLGEWKRAAEALGLGCEDYSDKASAG